VPDTAIKFISGVNRQSERRDTGNECSQEGRLMLVKTTQKVLVNERQSDDCSSKGKGSAASLSFVNSRQGKQKMSNICHDLDTPDSDPKERT
jgi:hypothetical protein